MPDSAVQALLVTTLEPSRFSTYSRVSPVHKILALLGANDFERRTVAADGDPRLEVVAFIGRAVGLVCDSDRTQVGLGRGSGHWSWQVTPSNMLVDRSSNGDGGRGSSENERLETHSDVLRTRWPSRRDMCNSPSLIYTC